MGHAPLSRAPYAHLADAWLHTARAAGARGDVAGAGARLIGAYADPARHYHDLTHLDEVLRHVDDLADAAHDPISVRLAAWFHDAVYDGTAEAERRSAELAEGELAALRVDESVRREVARLVLLTATHEPAADDANGAVLCDADLAVLASDPARYASYAAGVRQEYAHVPDRDFVAGRTAVLRRLLDRPELYRTDYARANWDERARRNIETELLLLSVEGDADPRPAAG